MSEIVIDGSLLDFFDAQRAGYTGPVLAFDLRAIERRLTALAALAAPAGGRVKFLFAHKSFPAAGVTELAARHLGGFDVANAGELRAVAPHAAGKLISVTGPRWHADARVESAAGVVIYNAASAHQLVVARARSASGAILGVRLRAEPSSRFGFASLADALRDGAEAREIGAIHVHRGTGDNDVAAYGRLVERVCAELQATGVAPRFVSLGGGFQRLELAELARVIDHALDRLPPTTTLVFEPGEFCVVGCGFAVCRVVDVAVRAPGELEAVLDASSGCHFKWSSPTFLLPQGRSDAASTTLTIWGATCHERDRIGRYRARLSRDQLAPGTFVVLGGVNGYSVAWTTGFNGIGEGHVRFLGP